MAPSSPRTLIFALAAKSLYRPVLYSENEIFCGPDEVTRSADGRIQIVNTPVGEFDVARVLDRLPSRDWPELVVVKADATRRLVPRGLSALSCPKVLALGDTHHLSAPIRFLIEYGLAEPFDFAVTDHDRHHLHWFKRAGLRNVSWLPGLNYCLRRRPVAPPAEKRAIFVGQTGAHHPYRRELFRALQGLGLPVAVQTAPPERTADLYARHAVSLNCSLNGDLNLRVFEILGSGGLLLTDRLSPASGLDRLFTDGEDLVLYSDLNDLAEKTRRYIEREDEALAIRRQGQARLLREHSPEQKARQLRELVFEGAIEPAFDLDSDPRIWSLANLPRESAQSDAAAYERLQAMHQHSQSLVVYGAPGSLPFAEDLPRMRYAGEDELGEDLPERLPEGLVETRCLALDGGDPARCEQRLARFVGDFVWIGGGSGEVAGLLSAKGYAAVAAAGALYERSDYVAAAADYAERGLPVAARDALSKIDLARLSIDALVLCAQIASACGDLRACEAALEQCIRSDRAMAEAYLARADTLRALGRDADALTTLYEARRLLGALPEESDALLRELEASPAGGSPQALLLRSRASLGASPRKLPAPRRILVYTNLFPPQELGGYGRKMWEFAYELSLRGHDIRVLAGDAPYLTKEAAGEEAALEDRVSRELQLYGKWEGGSVIAEPDPQEARRIMLSNAQKLVAAIGAFKPDFCLMGNLDLLGYLGIEQLTMRGIPTVQCMGNATPGWPQDFKPDYRCYAAGPASAFLQRQFADKGFRFERAEVLYPGARIDRFYREAMPRCDIPRIAFAGLLMPYKGAHTLVAALRLLKEGGIQFRATIAGDSTDRGYVEGLKRACEEGAFGDWVEFPGFLDRRRLAELFCRCNMMVFPSIFEEPFGISQVEAMASGLALITSGKGGSPEIARDGVDGLLFKAEDSLDLARKIASLVADPERWARLAMAGRERALEFSIPKTVDKIEALFAQMAASEA